MNTTKAVKPSNIKRIILFPCEKNAEINGNKEKRDDAPGYDAATAEPRDFARRASGRSKRVYPTRRAA